MLTPLRSTRLTDTTLRALLENHAPARSPSLLPELVSFVADDELPLWMALEAALGERLEAPFYAVPWPGAQAVARAILDGDVDVRARIVLELGCGSGLASLAAARAGAARVIASDVDPLALQTARISAVDNNVAIEVAVVDVLVADAAAIVGAADVIIAADVVYNSALGAALGAIIDAAVKDDVDIVVADSGRPFFDARGLARVRQYSVEVPVAVEGRARREVSLYRSTARMQRSAR